MIGLQLIQRQQQQQQQQLASDKHATDRHSTNNNNNNCKKRQHQHQHQQQHEQVFRANLVRIPSKVGSPMVNLSQFAHQQQQQQQRRRRQSSRTTTSAETATGTATAIAATTTTKELAGHNVMEAVAGRSVMIAEPVQRFSGDGKTSTLQDNDEMGHTNNVLLLIDEHTGEAPIVIGQRVSSVGGRNGLMPPVGMAPPGGGGGRAMSKTRQQLELLCAAADYKTISQQQQQQQQQQHHLDHKSAAIILAPVVVGRRSHRIQQQQQQLQLQKQHQQQQARYLFGEFAPELASAGVELRQHILRPIGIVEQIPALALAGQTARTINQISNSRSANVSSDGSRRSTSSSSSSSAASSSNSSEKRKSSSKATAASAAATSKYSNHHPQFHNGSGCISMLDIAINSSEYTLYEGSRFDAVPEYPIANADYPLSNSQRSDIKRTTGLKQASPTNNLTKSSKKTQPNKQQQQQQQQQLLLKPVCISANERQSINTCDTGNAYCCSDPNCGQYSPLPSQLLNYPVDKKSKAGVVAGGPMTRSVSCQKIQNISNNPTGCCGSSQVLTINQLIDHHFCQANGHSHPNYLPPLNKPASSPNNDYHHHHHNNQDHHHHQQQQQRQQRPIITKDGGQSMAANNVSARKVAYPSQPRSSSHDSPSGSQTSDLDDQEGTSAVEQMYESLAAELKAKLGNPQIGPILLPPRDYDTLCRRQGKLDGIEQRRSTNPQLVGPIVSDGPAKKLSNDSSSSGNSSLKSNN